MKNYNWTENPHLDEDDDEYYYEEEEEEPPPRRKRPNKKRRPSKKPNRRVSYSNNRDRNRDREDEDNNERVPFLVPLMMVPESEIGVDKKFSFSGDQLTPPNQQQRPNQIQNRPGQRFNNRPFNRPNCELLSLYH